MTSDDPDFTPYVQDGRVKRTTYTFFRGDHANFHPTDETLTKSNFISDYVVKGWMPPEPFINKSTGIVPFGSCFAANVRKYLANRQYRLLTTQNADTYVSSMGDGIVNTYAIRQQFEWAWLEQSPKGELWHGYKGESFGYDEAIRIATQEMFDACDVFIITLGLSEVWCDEVTGEVFWRAVPKQFYDPVRHKFRVTSVVENVANLTAIHSMIRKRRPEAAIIFTLSPVPLTATFRATSCITANSASKAILRAALDEFMRSPAGEDLRTFYFPSYEIVMGCFDNPMMEDRKHPHAHVIDFNMATFERYFCCSDLTDESLTELFLQARELDWRVVREGHFAVPRSMNPSAGGAIVKPGQDSQLATGK